MSAIVLGVGLVALGTPARASGPTDSISINVKAVVAQRCAIAAGQRTTKPVPIDQAQSFALGFELDCNTPFRISISSQSGALRLMGVPESAVALAGFGIEKPYRVALSMTTDTLGAIDAGDCPSQDLLAGAGACPFYGKVGGNAGFSPGAQETAIQRQGQLLISWAGDDASAPQRLAAGDYQDRLTVEVAPLL